MLTNNIFAKKKSQDETTVLNIMCYSKIIRTFSLSPAFTLVIGAMKKFNKLWSDKERLRTIRYQAYKKFCKNTFLKNFAKFTGKDLYRILINEVVNLQQFC